MQVNNHLDLLKNVLKWAKYVFTPLALIFLAYFAWLSRELILQLYNSAQLYLLFICIVIWVFLHLLSPIFTTRSFNAMYSSIDYRFALYIHCINLPAKYLPGGIWHSVARSHEYYNQGISGRKIGLYFLHENLLVAAVTLFVGGSLLIYSDLYLNFFYIIALLSVIGFTFIVFWPWLIKNLRPFGKLRININHYALAIFSMIAYWILASSSFIIFLNAFPDLQFSCDTVHVAGTYIFSWGIGFIAIFAPQGIGVSEVLASELLCSDIGSAALITLYASFRIIILTADLITWLLAYLMRTKIKMM